METIPRSARVFSSPASLVPLPSESTQTLRLPKISSLASITPSLLLSYCANASNPFAASVPSASRVWSPKSSPPLSIEPLLFKSRHKNPSFVVQLIFSANSFLSRSKYAPSSFVSILKPSPSRSKIIGSTLVVLAFNTCVLISPKYLPLTLSLIGSISFVSVLLI